MSGMADEPLGPLARRERAKAEEAELRVEEARLRVEQLKKPPSERKEFAEAEEVELRVREATLRLEQLAAPWRSPAIFVKWIVAGLVVGALFGVWGIGYLRPILLKNSELAVIETRRLTAQNQELTASQAEFRRRSAAETETLNLRREQLERDLTAVREEGRVEAAEHAEFVNQIEAQLSDAVALGAIGEEAAARLRAQLVVAQRAAGDATRRADAAEDLRIGTRAVESAETKLQGFNEFVFIEGGSFLMGSPPDEGDPDEHPQRRVTLSPFHIQKYEVTNQEYALFDRIRSFDADEGAHPVVEVSWDDAMSYAEWLGGRLPTEAQWEFVARGEGREYPWGPGPARAGTHGNWASRETVPVGSFPDGATPEGVYDLAGNVWEWCLDWYGPLYPQADETNPRGSASGLGRVLRGGSFSDTDEGSVRAAWRNWDSPDRRNFDVGFRVVVSPFSSGL